jgi:hypothetical protein
MIWIADAHRGDGKRFVVRADEKLTAFLEFESTIPSEQGVIGNCAAIGEVAYVGRYLTRQLAHVLHRNTSTFLAKVFKSEPDYVIRRFNLSSARLDKPSFAGNRTKK